MNDSNRRDARSNEQNTRSSNAGDETKREEETRKKQGNVESRSS